MSVASASVRCPKAPFGPTGMGGQMPEPSLALPCLSTVTMSETDQVPRPVALSDVMFFETGWIISVLANSDEKSSPPAKKCASSRTVADPGSRCLVWHSTQIPPLAARYCPRIALPRFG